MLPGKLEAGWARLGTNQRVCGVTAHGSSLITSLGCQWSPHNSAREMLALGTGMEIRRDRARQCPERGRQAWRGRPNSSHAKGGRSNPREKIPETEEDTQEHPILSRGEGSDPEMPA